MRNYERKTDRGYHPPDIIIRATSDVIDSGRSFRKVGADFNMDPSTLFRYVKQERDKRNENGSNITFGYKQTRLVLTRDQEHELEKYILSAAKIYYGLTPKDVRVLAYQCAKSYGILMRA